MLGENAGMPFRRVLVALVAAAVLWPTAATAKPIPEADASAGPGEDAGYFLGYPSPTYSWHGCTKTSTQDTPTTLDPGVPGIGPGNKQKKVTWTLESRPPPRPATRCGGRSPRAGRSAAPRSAMRGSKADADADYAMQAGYTSKGTKGNTVTAG